MTAARGGVRRDPFAAAAAAAAMARARSEGGDALDDTVLVWKTSHYLCRRNLYGEVSVGSG